jgi:hypothetical protein
MFVQVFVMIRKPRLLARSSQPTLKRVRMPHVARIRVGLGFGEGVLVVKCDCLRLSYLQFLPD